MDVLRGLCAIYQSAKDSMGLQTQLTPILPLGFFYPRLRMIMMVMSS